MRRRSGSTVTRKATWTAATSLDPGRRILIANAAGVYAAVADLTYSGGFAATGGAMALRVVGGAPIERSAWGDATNGFVEGAAAAAPPLGRAWNGRRAAHSGMAATRTTTPPTGSSRRRRRRRVSRRRRCPCRVRHPRRRRPRRPRRRRPRHRRRRRHRRRLRHRDTDADSDGHAHPDSDADADSRRRRRPRHRLRLRRRPRSRRRSQRRPRRPHRRRLPRRCRSRRLAASPTARTVTIEGVLTTRARSPRVGPGRVHPGRDRRDRAVSRRGGRRATGRRARPSRCDGTLDSRFSQRILRVAEAAIASGSNEALPDPVDVAGRSPPANRSKAFGSASRGSSPDSPDSLSDGTGITVDDGSGRDPRGRRAGGAGRSDARRRA